MVFRPSRQADMDDDIRLNPLKNGVVFRQDSILKTKAKPGLNPLKNGVVFRHQQLRRGRIRGQSQSPEERGGLSTRHP